VLTNLAEIEQLMVSRGYVVIEPEKLTFLEQNQLFRNAKDIVAPTGAALANAIFCRPGARVAVLMAKHDSMIYRYWHNMLTPLRIMVGLVLGNPLNAKELGIHAHYTVNVEDVANLLEAMEGK
jgi:capsular polysaccharide biosynthesis protein